jgi:hypothetical protein
MSVRFTVEGTVALIECNCAACDDAAACDGCALCGWAAEAEESCGLSRMAAAANKRHETAVMVKNDERRKRILQEMTWLDAIPHKIEELGYARSSPGHRRCGAGLIPFFVPRDAQTISLPFRLTFHWGLF